MKLVAACCHQFYEINKRYTNLLTMYQRFNRLARNQNLDPLFLLSGVDDIQIFRFKMVQGVHYMMIL